MKIVLVVLGLTLLCGVVMILPHSSLGAAGTRSSARDGIAASEANLLLDPELENARVDAGQSRVGAAPIEVRADADVPPYSPLFDVRHGTLGSPSQIRGADDLSTCSVLNPRQVQLDEEQLARLQGVIDSANQRLSAYRDRALGLLLDCTRDKVVTFGEGQDLRGDVVRPARSEDCFVGTYTCADESIPDQLVVIYPGEFPVLDSSFDDGWLELDLTHEQIAAFFAGL